MSPRRKLVRRTRLEGHETPRGRRSRPRGAGSRRGSGPLNRGLAAQTGAGGPARRLASGWVPSMSPPHAQPWLAANLRGFAFWDYMNKYITAAPPSLWPVAHQLARPRRPAPFAGTRRRPLPVARAARSPMRGTRTPAPVPTSPGRCSVHASVWGLSCDELHTTCCPSRATCLESRSAPERPPCPATSCCSVLPRPLAAAGVRLRLGIPCGPWGQALRLVHPRLPAPWPRVP